ncbi:MAG TPA: NAD(P)H-hydrate dehydratase [Bryobacteraceae bacterium]|jgi:NAD(P)H-hydrate epimerase|nr:NAD(P)H-hydrate dehydratase [Bryobacteraceae bacterium]
MTPVLTVAQMNAADKATIDAGIPGIVLMENAAHRVVEYIERHFAPVDAHRIAVICGKGNNGGDGLAIARILHTRFHPPHLETVLIPDPAELSGDAAANLKMLRAAGLREKRERSIAPTLIVDAILGTGLKGPAKGPALDAIRLINSFTDAKVIAVDIPSGLAGDSAIPPGEYVRAHATVTFTSPKICHALHPARVLMGDLHIRQIGTPPTLLPETQLALIDPQSIASLFAPRATDANKGRYGHVLVVAGSRGKSGAAAMCGIAALRAGAGLVTVACPKSALDAVAAAGPEIMTEPLPETASGEIARDALDVIRRLAEKRTLIAIGPGIGTDAETREVVTALYAASEKPMVIDADALNCLVNSGWPHPPAPRILTPHPGEMSRLANRPIPEIQADRLGAARAFASERALTLVLKGEGTVIAFPDGRTWINTTGSPAMATGGTGDILTGMTAGLAAQFPRDLDRAAAGAIYLHGLAGEIAARHLGEQPVIATDLLRYLPEGIRAIANLRD